MKLVVDTTLPPQQFQRELIEAARAARIRAEHIRDLTAHYVALGWQRCSALRMAEVIVGPNEVRA